MDVLRAAQREVDHAGADRGVGEAVDQDERAGLAALLRTGRRRSAWSSDTLQMPISFSSSFFAARCSSVLTLTLYFGSVIVAETCLVPSLQPVRAPGQHRLVGHPDHDRLELVGDAGQVVRARDDVAAADVDLVGERQRDGLAGDGVLEIAVHRDDAGDRAFATRGQDANLVALPHHAARDRAGEAAEIEVRDG